MDVAASEANTLILLETLLFKHQFAKAACLLINYQLLNSIFCHFLTGGEEVEAPGDTMLVLERGSHAPVSVSPKQQTGRTCLTPVSMRCTPAEHPALHWHREILASQALGSGVQSLAGEDMGVTEVTCMAVI